MKFILVLLSAIAMPLVGHATETNGDRMARIIPKLLDACAVLRQKAEEHLRRTQPARMTCQEAGRIPKDALDSFHQDFDNGCVEQFKAQIEPQLSADPHARGVHMSMDEIAIWTQYEQGFEKVYSRYCEGGTSL